DQLETFWEARGQTVRNHILHMISVVEAGYQSRERGTLSIEDMHRAREQWWRSTPQEIAEYADDVRATITTFLLHGDEEELNRVVASHYGGDVAVVEVLQVLLRHSGHHLRQLYDYMEHDIDVPPDGPLGDDDFEGIDVPTKLFIEQ